MSEIVAARQSRPWIQPNILFQMSKYSSKQRKVLCVLHSFTDDVSFYSWRFSWTFWNNVLKVNFMRQVIRRRKMERMEQNTNKITAQYQEDDSFVASKFIEVFSKEIE